MSGVSRHRVDAVVVGGGVIGLAVAFELGRRGREVTVLERTVCGAGATRAAGGMLAAAAEAETEPQDLVQLGRDSLQRYPEFVSAIEAASGLACGHRQDGTLWIATRRDSREELEHLEQTLREKGIAASLLTGPQVLDREPRLAGGILGGLWLQHDGQVDPRALSGALAAAIARSGGTIAESTRVETIEAEAPQRIAVRGRRGTEDRPFTIESRDVVLAAGAWSGRGLHPSADAIGLRPVKGQLLRLQGQPLLQHVVRTNEVYLIPRATGELLVGATAEEMGFDETPTAGAAMDLLRRAWEVLPAIYELEFKEVSVGLRPATDDHMPVIGPAGPAGLWLAVGHHRNGVLLAPSTAAHLAQWITDGREPSELAPFSAQRIHPRKQLGKKVPTWTAS